MNRKPLTVSCPQCNKKIIWSDANTYRPFCSERCKLIDLGAWASEKHVIKGRALSDEIDGESFENDSP